jgi:hypothetical protein
MSVTVDTRNINIEYWWRDIDRGTPKYSRNPTKTVTGQHPRLLHEITATFYT